MQTTRDDHQPLLGGEGQEDPSQVRSISTMRAYRLGALGGPGAQATQAFGLVFVILVWGLVFSVFSFTSLPLFGYHPIVQSLALLLLLQSILTLQPTSQSQPSQKQSAFKIHQVINLLLVLPLFTVGVAIMWYLHDQPGASHFISWHGKLGFAALIWAWLQVAVGVAATAFNARLVGGPSRGKALYKWHRLSGYILLPLFLFTAFLGAAQTTWSSQNASKTHHIAVAVCLLGAAIGIAIRVQSGKLPRP